MDETENQISDLQYKKAEDTQSEQQEDKESPEMRILWDNFKCTNIHIMGLPQEEREQEIENLFQKMTENFPNLVKGIDIQVQEVQRVPNKMNLKGPTPRHIIIKCQRLNTKNES